MRTPWRKIGPFGSLTNVTFLFAACLVVATVLMFWLGVRATRAWERSTRESVESHGNEALSLLVIALERDMVGGQASVLPLNQLVLKQSSTYDLADRFGRAFARFPYVESFFVWTALDGQDGRAYFFDRAERLPPWDDESDPTDPYPVSVRVNPAGMRPMLDAVRARAATGTPYTLIETEIAHVRYQAVSHLEYAEGPDKSLRAAVGYTVNMNWVRGHYFDDLIHQVQKVSGDPTVTIQIRDETGKTVAVTGPPASGEVFKARTFPLVFCDRTILPAPMSHYPTWTAAVGVTNSGTLLAARASSARTLELLGLGGFVSLVALMLTVRTSRAAARLAMRQSDFVTAVTHEMKTPLSLIMLTGDNLAQGRYASGETVREYGQLISSEGHQLTRLVDNVLCYARLIDSASSYEFDVVDVVELVNESIDRLRIEIESAGLDIDVDLPLHATPVRADRRMLQDAIDNVIENAIKHGGSGEYLRVRVMFNEHIVRIEVTDRGVGLAPDELARVFEKFYRGRNAKRRGSGLGLTIVRRIVEEHGGTVTIRSVEGQGTSVELQLPAQPAL